MSSKRQETVIRNVTITGARRLANSRNGNPRYDVALSDGSVRLTQSDASCSYEISNYAGRPVALDVTLTPAGRISYVRPAMDPAAQSMITETQELIAQLSAKYGLDS